MTKLKLTTVYKMGSGNAPLPSKEHDMKQEYIQSEELYKGYTLKVVMTCLSNDMRYHRKCEAWKNGKLVSVGKSKKEMKELITDGYIQVFE